MKLIDSNHQHPPFDVASGLAASLIESGKYEQYLPPAPPTKSPNTKWVVRVDALGDSTDEPCIFYSCSTCGNKGLLTGRTCHKTQVARHCGVTESVPPEIQQQYERLRRKFDGGRTEKVKTLRERAEALKSSVVRTV